MRKVFKIIVVVLVIFVLLAVIGAVVGPSKTANQSAIDQPIVPVTPVTPAVPETPVTPVTPVVPETPVPVPPAARANTTVYFIDVGQGDSELIVTPDNKTILIDTGPSSAQSAVISFVQAHTWGTIDVLVLTHPDADHIGSAVAVMNSFTVKSIYHSGYVGTSQTYAKFMTGAASEGCPIYTDAQVDAGDIMNWSSSVTIRVMAINADAANPNDASLVLQLTDGSVSYLFMGDASSAVESQMVTAFGAGLEAEILKVGHHGSSSATSDAFLSAVAPKIGIIEVGAGNTYGHPTDPILTRLASDSISVYRTDLNGTVMITGNETDVRIMSFPS